LGEKPSLDEDHLVGKERVERNVEHPPIPQTFAPHCHPGMNKNNMIIFVYPHPCFSTGVPWNF